MDAFTYYFDISFLPVTFDTYFDKQIINNVVPKKKDTILETKTQQLKYISKVIEPSCLEFKRTKYNNRNTPKNKNKNKRK